MIQFSSDVEAADALAAAAGCQVASKPHVQVLVVNHDGVTEVCAVAGAEGLACVPSGPPVGGVGEAAVAARRCAAVVVIDDAGVIGAAPFHGLRLCHVGIASIRDDDIYVGTADEQRRWQQFLDKLLREAVRGRS